MHSFASSLRQRSNLNQPAAQGRYELPSCSATSPNFALRLAFSAQVLGPPRIASVSDALSASRARSDKLSLEATQTEVFQGFSAYPYPAGSLQPEGRRNDLRAEIR